MFIIIIQINTLTGTQECYITLYTVHVPPVIHMEVKVLNFYLLTLFFIKNLKKNEKKILSSLLKLN